MNDKIYFVTILVKQFSKLLYEIETQLLLARICSTESVNKKQLQITIRRAEWCYLLLVRLRGFSYGLTGSLLGVGHQAVRERTRKGARFFCNLSFPGNREKRDQFFTFIDGQAYCKDSQIPTVIKQFNEDQKLLKGYQEAYYSIWPMYNVPNTFSKTKEILSDKSTVMKELEKIYHDKKCAVEKAIAKGEITNKVKSDITKVRRMFATLARAKGATFAKIGLALDITNERARQLDAFGYRDFKYPHYIDEKGIERRINEVSNRNRKESLCSETELNEEGALIKSYFKKLNEVK